MSVLRSNVGNVVDNRMTFFFLSLNIGIRHFFTTFEGTVWMIVCWGSSSPHLQSSRPGKSSSCLAPPKFHLEELDEKISRAILMSGLKTRISCGFFLWIFPIHDLPVHRWPPTRAFKRVAPPCAWRSPDGVIADGVLLRCATGDMVGGQWIGA